MNEPSRQYSDILNPPLGPSRTPTAVSLVSAAQGGLLDDGHDLALAVLEATVGTLPRLELLSSVSHMTPEVFAASIDAAGRRLALDERHDAEHYLGIARAALALWLFRSGMLTMLPEAVPLEEAGA